MRENSAKMITARPLFAEDCDVSRYFLYFCTMGIGYCLQRAALLRITRYFRGGDCATLGYGFDADGAGGNGPHVWIRRLFLDVRQRRQKGRVFVGVEAARHVQGRWIDGR